MLGAHMRLLAADTEMVAGHFRYKPLAERGEDCEKVMRSQVTILNLYSAHLLPLPWPGSFGRY
jgi:hypothetical protein